jgi:uncharacterized membrane protein
MPAFAADAPPARLPAIDIARGVALAAMALYHFGWDLSFYRLIAADVGLDPAWQWAARVIAGSFLTLVGVSLALAHGTGIRWPAFLRRLSLVAGAALLITVATFFAFPDSYIFFGILHCIALSSVMALPFLQMPIVVLVIAAAACFAAPLLFTQPVFDWPPLEFLGLGQRTPAANDYVPLFPWFAFVLVGLGLGRVVLWSRARWLRRPPEGAVARGLAWAGRRSLAVYLLHQPILMGALYPVALALGPNPAAEAARFLRSHERSCAQAGASPEICRSSGACLAEGLRAEGLWTGVLEDRLPQDDGRVLALSRRCFERAKAQRPRPPSTQ